MPSVPTIIRSVLAACGSAMLCIGAFSPTVAYRTEDGQLVAAQSYFADASGDALIVVMCAALVLAACLFRRMSLLRIAGAAALVFIAIGFAREFSAEHTILARPTVIVGVHWGWALLWIGAAFAALAGWFVDARPCAATR